MPLLNKYISNFQFTIHNIQILVPILLLVFFILPQKSYAANSPTPIPTGCITCDICGWCGKCQPTVASGPTLTIAPSPYNWQSCWNCHYPTNAAGVPEFSEKRYYTIFGCLDTNAGNLTQVILRVVFSIAGGIAFISVLYGAAIVLTSTGNPENIRDGKDVITNSLLGMLIILFSAFLLKLVGVDILQLPGFG